MYVLDQHFENYGAAFIRHDNVDFVLTPLQCGIFRDVISVVRDGLGSGKFSDFRKMAPPPLELFQKFICSVLVP